MYSIEITDLRLLNVMYMDNNFLIERLSTLIEIVGFDQKIKILAFESKRSMERYFGNILPSWIKGVALDNNEVLVNCRSLEEINITLQEVILHECIHIILKKYRLPIWINEGCAVYFSGQYSTMGERQKEALENPYDICYETDDFYYNSAYVIKKLCDIYGEKCIIQHFQECKNFEDDEILGKNAVEKLLRMEE